MTANISLVKSQIKQPDTYAYTRGVEAFEEEKYADALDWFNRELNLIHPINFSLLLNIPTMAMRMSMSRFSVMEIKNTEKPCLQLIEL